MQSVFYAPVIAIMLEHLRGIHLRRWARADQILCFAIWIGFVGNLKATCELSGLFSKREPDASGSDREGL